MSEQESDIDNNDLINVLILIIGLLVFLIGGYVLAGFPGILLAWGWSMTFVAVSTLVCASIRKAILRTKP
jgi:hypothetical protein